MYRWKIFAFARPTPPGETKNERHACRVSQKGKKKNGKIFFHVENKTLFYFFFPARPCAVVSALSRRVRVVIDTSSVWVSPGENTTRGRFEKFEKKNKVSKSCVGFCYFVLRFGGGGERLIEFRKRKK